MFGEGAVQLWRMDCAVRARDRFGICRSAGCHADNKRHRTMRVKTRHTGAFRIGCWVPAMILDASARSANAVRLVDACARTIPHFLPSHAPPVDHRSFGTGDQSINACNLVKIEEHAIHNVVVGVRALSVTTTREEITHVGEVLFT